MATRAGTAGPGAGTAPESLALLARILVPLDDSGLAARALPYAVTLARAAGGRLLLARVIVAVPDAASRTQAQAELDAAAGRLRRRGVPAEGCVLTGDAGPAIAGAPRSVRASLIAMATFGYGGLPRWIFGSVADHVLRHAPVPVLLIPAACERTWLEKRGAWPARVLVALDGSATAEAVLGPARTLCAALGATLSLVRVVPPGLTPDPRAAAERYLEALAQPLGGPGRSVEIEVVTGAPAPAPALAALAREREAAALALATHGRGGLTRVVLGSVAAGVLQRATVPLLLARPDARVTVR
jgi:nucleotide-binding universal stress UspA family protein